MRRARLISLILCAAAGKTPLAAQWRLTGDVGVSRLRQTAIPESNALTFGGTVDAAGERAAFRSTALAAWAPADRWTGQVVAIGTLLGSASRPIRWELTALASVFGESSAPPTTSAELMAGVRGNDATSSGGAALRLGGGLLNDVAGGRPLYHAQANAWQLVNENQLLGDVTFVGTWTTPPNATDGCFCGWQGLSYVDLTGRWRRDATRVSVGATAGARVGTANAASDGFGSVDATLWLAPDAGIVMTAGRALADVIRGVPRTSYVSVAFRVTAVPRPHAPQPRTRTPASARGLELTASRERIEVVVPGSAVVGGGGAARVELMADFTDWMPVALERAGDVWRLERAIAPGLHRIALRIDGGDWITPVNLPRATDDLGGVVGLITVP